MQIVISTYTYLPDIGGVASTVSFLARGFVEAGHDVTIVTLTRDAFDDDPHIKLVVRPSFLKMLSLYRKADVLLLSNLSLRLGVPALFRGKKYGLHHHSESAFHLSRKLFSGDFVRRLISGKAVHFMTSAFTGQKSGFSSYDVVHPFANPKYITPEVVLPPEQRAGALFVGRITEEKGVFFLLSHMEEIGEKLGIEDFFFVGGGPDEEKLVLEIKKQKRVNVHFLGAKSLKETATLMGQTAYVFVPSLWQEPFGAVALEGLAAGALVLHTGRGGLKEACGDLGFLFEADEPASLEKALSAATATFSSFKESSQKWEAYQEDVQKHLSNFTPLSAAQKILKRMLSS